MGPLSLQDKVQILILNHRALHSPACQFSSVQQMVPSAFHVPGHARHLKPKDSADRWQRGKHAVDAKWWTQQTTGGLETQPLGGSSCRELVKDQGYREISSSTSRALSTTQCSLATRCVSCPIQGTKTQQKGKTWDDPWLRYKLSTKMQTP